MKKIYLIAGEASGDRIGAELIESLKGIYGKEVRFYGVGGQLMSGKGFQSLFMNSQISLMGFLEVLPHIFRIKKLINRTVADILSIKPDILITIDSPGFNFRVASKVRALAWPSLKLVHFVAPSVWAYKEKRAVQYAAIYDHLLALFPFEAPYFEKHGLNVTCVGHPIFDYNYDALREATFRIKHHIEADKKLICVTPGSRKGEILRHMPVLLAVIDILAQEFEGLVIGIPAASIELASFIKNLVGDTSHKVIIVINDEDKLNLYKSADLALAKSGTNTLEIAACGTPQIVFYRLNPITWLILKWLVKVKFASIINILADKEIIPEFLQSNFKIELLVAKAREYLGDKKFAKQQITAAQDILQTIGFRSQENASLKAAKAIQNILV